MQRREHGTVLVVDDNPANRYYLTRILARGGYLVVEAETGSEAITRITQSHPDVIILDVQLPDINGYALARRLKADPSIATIPILQTSAEMTRPEDQAQGLEAGADAYLLQPIDATVLLASVKSLLRVRHAEAERDRLIRELARQRALLEAVLHQMPAAVMIAEAPKGNIILSNHRVTQILGSSSAPASGLEAYGQYDFLHKDGHTLDPAEYPLARALLRGEGANGEEIHVRRTDGTQGVLLASSAPVLNEANQIIAAVSTLVDVTDWKLAEQERAALLEELQHALRVRDELISVASHELRTPLTGLQLNIELLRRISDKNPERPFTAEELATRLKPAERQVHRLTEMLDRLLDLSRIRNNRMVLDLAVVDLCDLVRENLSRLKILAERAGSELRMSQCGSIIAYVDQFRLEQVVSNLVSNAIKYGRSRPIDVEVRADDELACIEVRDEGIGIASEDVERIFDPFERATVAQKRQSLGLGLFITREIVRMHGGSIQVLSEPGRGSRFVVELPRRPPPGS